MKSLGSRIALLTAVLCLQTAHVSAQQPVPLRPGEAFVTRFSGTASIPGPGGTPLLVVNPGGVVGSVIDLRNPGQPPQGQHWIGEPQRLFVTAADVGQVFGVTLDDAPVPNIFLAATAAFGLHRMPGNAQWQPGMWGSGGGPGTVYRIGPATNYVPQPFAQITLGGRPNTGAALGNIAHDRWNRQLYVSDLETGMIHRIRAADGADLGFYDHGMRGRPNFFDAATGQQSALPPVAFDPATAARIADCPSGRFENAPECWNLAANGRRVWGVGVWRNSTTNEVRLYYAAWSSPAFDPDGWLAAGDDDKRNSVWSVGIGADGSFNHSSVRREFLLPDFFVGAADIARAGFSQPVSDIAFPTSPGLPLMIVAERGGMRNLGLGEQNPFATPHESRALRYELHQDGVWRPIGRYEIGFYDRANEGNPRMRANSAGSAAFGPGYSNRWTVNANQPDQYVWITGDALCSPDGPCNLAASAGEESGDDSEVHGIQGLREDFYDEVAPASAYGLAPEQQSDSGQTSAVGPDEAYLIDVDINMTPAGAPVVEEFVRNDASLVGGIAVFQQVAVQPVGVVYPLPPAPPILIAEPGHDSNFSHARYGSHGQQQSHYRFASHWPAMSHQRYGSHNQNWSHYQYASHNLKWSHSRFGSHSSNATHNKLGSHKQALSHFSKASKVHLLAASHKQFGSHNAIQSITDKHNVVKSTTDKHNIAKSLADKHNAVISKIHVVAKSQADKHNIAKSLADKHNAAISKIHLVAKSEADKHGVAKSLADKHNATISKLHIVAKSEADKHGVAKSLADKHNATISKIHLVAKSEADKHGVAKSLADKHNATISKIHVVAKSEADKHGVAKSLADKHNVAISKIKAPTPVHAPANSTKLKQPFVTPAPKGLPPVEIEKKLELPKAPVAPKAPAQLKIETPKAPELPKVVAPKTVTPLIKTAPVQQQLKATVAQPKATLQVQPKGETPAATKSQLPAKTKHNAATSAKVNEIKKLEEK